MTEERHPHILPGLRKKWILISLCTDFVFAGGLALLFSVIANRFLGINFWSLPCALLFIFGLLLITRTAWKISDFKISQWLNQEFPLLEESAGLLLKETHELNSLERIQQLQTIERISALERPLPTGKKTRVTVIALVSLILLSLVIYHYPGQDHKEKALNMVHSREATNEKVPARIAAIEIGIQPPAYTSRPARTQTELNLSVEEGAAVNWAVRTNIRVNEIKLVFNDSVSVLLQQSDSSHRSWTINRKLDVPGFYQIVINGMVSSLYRIETIKDRIPLIHLSAPEQYSTIEFGQSPQVKAKIEMEDDYGIRETFLNATISSGSGEAVKFKEHKIQLPGFVAGGTHYQLEKLLNLTELGMQPGDELYFYINAIDNHRQEARSDIFIINLPDTAGLLSLEGLANSVNIKPEYFRSQRQIIIETEQLLKDKDSIGAEAFKNRSNNLGIDQKMLRLRYGKFLGEEDESGTNDEHRNELEDPANFSNAEKLKEAFTDQHDRAEDASFFEPELKKQLKATLTEMWNAELPLRLFKPQEALPFEYKALRLLKDLQQKTRVYVAKTNSKTTPLDLKKRLTADLSKISDPLLRRDLSAGKDPQQAMREALSLLQELASTEHAMHPPDGGFTPVLLLLNAAAVKQPAIYLKGLESLKSILQGMNSGLPLNNEDIRIVSSAFQRLLSRPEDLPGLKNETANDPLSKQYFKNLQQPPR